MHAIDYKREWIRIQSAFPILCDVYALPFTVHTLNEEFLTLAKNIEALNLTEMIQNLVINRIEKHVREIIGPEFWAYFKQTDKDNEGFQDFYCAIELLYEYFKQFSILANNIELLREVSSFTKPIYQETSMQNALKVIFHSVLLSQIPNNYTKCIKSFYSVALRMQNKEDFFVDNQCRICQHEACLCQQYFTETNEKLVKLGLLEPLVGQILTSLIYEHIELHVEKTCKDIYDTTFMSVNDENSLYQWLKNVIIPWIEKIYQLNSTEKSLDAERMSLKLVNFLFESYTMLRISQLFNIIIEYPESIPALEDLNSCLLKIDLRSHLTKSLQKAMETRLLHPGVSTPDILTAYVATIRSLRVLDPSGILLETITKPVHEYLHSRDDTIRCVVSSLTEEGPNDLSEELVRPDAIPVDENTPVEENYENWQNWLPDPVEVGTKATTSGSRKSSDIISMLVNVYGSKEVFINEYRTLLADRLLSQFTCDAEKEIRYLELLKLRFGESILHHCEVMMKDIAESKRISQHIKQDPEYSEDEVPVTAMVLSGQFWPAFKEEKLQLHGKISEQLEKYTKGFEILKGNRTLVWMNHLGLVDLEIEMPNRVLKLSVSPTHATIIMHFQDRKTWVLEELSKVMAMSATCLRKKISFWQSYGLIAEKGETFQLVEESDTKSNQNDIVLEEETESVMASVQDQREEELQTIWSYINGMLINLEALNLERIHQMLKMFNLECSLSELRLFLDRKVREHRLIYSSGLYKLPKT